MNEYHPGPGTQRRVSRQPSNEAPRQGACRTRDVVAAFINSLRKRPSGQQQSAWGRQRLGVGIGHSLTHRNRVDGVRQGGTADVSGSRDLHLHGGCRGPTRLARGIRVQGNNGQARRRCCQSAKPQRPRRQRKLRRKKPRPRPLPRRPQNWWLSRLPPRRQRRQPRQRNVQQNPRPPRKLPPPRRRRNRQPSRSLHRLRRLQPPPPTATPNYSGACVPIASDVDCAGGSGNGPAYVQGPVTVTGSDIYRLDSNNDGVGCEG
jgi:hypothetical protein